MTEHTWARWRSTIEQAADSVAERWQGRSVPGDPLAAAVAYGLAAWWLEEGRVAETRRYAAAAVVLDAHLRAPVDRLLEWAAVKCRPKRNAWLVGAFVADLEG